MRVWSGGIEERSMKAREYTSRDRDSLIPLHAAFRVAIASLRRTEPSPDLRSAVQTLRQGSGARLACVQLGGYRRQTEGSFWVMDGAAYVGQELSTADAVLFRGPCGGK